MEIVSDGDESKTSDKRINKVENMDRNSININLISQSDESISQTTFKKEIYINKNGRLT